MKSKKLLGSIIGVTLLGILVTGSTYAWLTFGVNVLAGNLSAGLTNFIVDYQKGTDISNLPILNSNMAKPAGNTATSNDAVSLSVLIKKPTSSLVDSYASIWLKPTSDNTLTKTGQVVRWAICRDPNVSDLKDNSCGGITNFSVGFDTTSGTGTGGVINTGVVTGTAPIPLLNDARLAELSNGTSHSSGAGSTYASGCSTSNGYSFCNALSDDHLSKGFQLNTTGVQYFVYFWLDGENIQNEHLDEQYYKTGTSQQYKIGGGGTPDYASGIKYSLFSGYIFASATQVIYD